MDQCGIFITCVGMKTEAWANEFTLCEETSQTIFDCQETLQTILLSRNPLLPLFSHIDFKMRHHIKNISISTSHKFRPENLFLNGSNVSTTNFNAKDVIVLVVPTSI